MSRLLFDQLLTWQAMIIGQSRQAHLHRHRMISAALYRRVVGDDHALDATYSADTGNNASGVKITAVHFPRGECA